MSPAEVALRYFDVGRREPVDAVLDRLEAEGHARNGFCEKCWVEAGKDATAYLALLDEREQVTR